VKPTSVRIITCILLVCVAIGAASAATIGLKDPIKLSDGQMLKAIYYFPHWWEPWKSDDALVTGDLKKMKELGFNTVCLDHEVSQAVDREFYWLDREYKLAAQEKMSILPWLQLQAVDRNALMEFTHLTLKQAVNQDKQPEADCIIYGDPEFKKALVHYVTVYLDRYVNESALLNIQDGKRTRPVVGLMIETGWRSPSGLPLSFDDETNAYFRKWMKASYYDIKHLNKKWGTTYKSYDEIDPCDKTIFNYAFTDRANPPMAVQQHVIFRARVIKETLAEVAREVRKRHGDVLFVAEVAYPFVSDDPNADAYRWNDANEQTAVEFADIIFIRTLGGPVTKPVVDQGTFLKPFAKRVVLAYRLLDGADPASAVSLALDCAMNSNGFALYNWNENADQSSAVYNKPDRQPIVKVMTSAYESLNGSEKLQEIKIIPAVRKEGDVAPVEPAVETPPAPVTPPVPPAPAPEQPAPAPAAPATETPAPASN
jgi:hypothetical protein